MKEYLLEGGPENSPCFLPRHSILFLIITAVEKPPPEKQGRHTEHPDIGVRTLRSDRCCVVCVREGIRG